MRLIVDFYNGLDTINLILFWGIIIVIFLLLVFSIIIANKNKKLKRMLIDQNAEIEESKTKLAIKEEEIERSKTKLAKKEEEIKKSKTKLAKKEEEIKKAQEIINIENEQEININNERKLNIENEQTIDIGLGRNINIDKKEKKIEINNNINPELPVIPPLEESSFVAEEHVIEYNKPTMKTVIPEPPIIEEDEFEEIENKKEEVVIPNAPYQKNVLRELSLNQTSPIGITKKENNINIEISKAQELNENLQNVEEYYPKETYENNYKKEMDNSKEMINKIYEKQEENNRYLKEVSQKLTEAKEDIKRTEYELKQEEDAIISYEELMNKKDSLKINDDEDAIISIDELYHKKNSEEKIYGITKDEEDDRFISELKHFRSDL